MHGTTFQRKKKLYIYLSYYPSSTNVQYMHLNSRKEWHKRMHTRNFEIVGTPLCATYKKATRSISQNKQKPTKKKLKSKKISINFEQLQTIYDNHQVQREFLIYKYYQQICEPFVFIFQHSFLQVNHVTEITQNLV